MPEDSAPERWVYREHTRVKHVLLEKYLRGWIPILGKYHPQICYIDGFAGRGEWEGGFPGSPVIAIRVAHELEKYFGEFVCINIELDPDNFRNLESVLSECHYPKIKNINIQGSFADVVGKVLIQVKASGIPSFFFIDPFGFGGVPFAIIRDILSIRRTEVFITFMYRDINRFLESSAAQEALDKLFGIRVSEQLQRTPSSREHALRNLYVKQLQEAASARFVWPFRISMTEERRTLYYLIYATNHFKGLMLMKTVMHNQGPGGVFSYLGPEDKPRRIQLSFFGEDIEPLRNLLLSQFKGRELTYDEIEEETWDAPFVDKHYRTALKEMEDEGIITVKRVSSKRRGLWGKDEISFP